MPQLTYFYQFKEDLAKKVHNLATDSLRVILSNTAPALTDTVKANITEISGGGGYTSNGKLLTVTTAAQTSGVFFLICNDETWTGTSGGFTFRYAVVFNDTPTSPADPLIGWVDYGYTVTVGTSQTFTFDSDQSNGLIQIA